MKIGLIDVDGHNYPNLPLMKLSAWHKARGDVVEWYEPLKGLIEKYDKVYLSKVFSFTPDYQYPIYADTIEKGGSGYAIRYENGREIFDKEKNKNLSEFWRDQKNIVLNDPNILACKDHLELLRQLADSGATVEFNQGLDIRLINDKNIELLKRIRLKNIHFAFDRWQDKDIIEPKLREFAEKTGFNKDRGHVMVYILTNFDTTIEQDIYRIQLCRSLYFSPFPMVYDKEHAAPIYRKLQRWCNNVIFWKVPTFEEYKANTKK